MLTARKTDILNLIVNDYIEAAVPIASESIARKHDLGISSATVRNDVAELEREGYITRPYSSAGSVPVEKGYRLYVDTSVASMENQISEEARSVINDRLVEVEHDIDAWTNVAAVVLSGLVGNMAIATFPKAKQSRVKHVELVRLSDFLALLMVIFEEASMRRQIVRVKQPVDPESLKKSTDKFNNVFVGLTRAEIESKQMVLSPLEKEFMDTTVSMLREEDCSGHLGHYVDGLRNLLSQPEFSDKDQVRAVVEAVEDGSLPQAILDEVPETGVVRVVIGRENRGYMLWPLSIVIGRYGVFGEASGVVGAVGPVRMQYSKAIAGVQFMVGVMSDLAESVYSR